MTTVTLDIDAVNAVKPNPRTPSAPGEVHLGLVRDPRVEEFITSMLAEWEFSADEVFVAARVVHQPTS